MRTHSAKASEIQRDWFVIDADGLVLGRLATEVARILRGKHKPIFTPHLDTGDHVVIVNADRVRLTGKKEADKKYFTHTMYPGGVRWRSVAEVRETHPDHMVRHAVKGMLPKNTLGRAMLRKLKVYAGPEHPHVAQSPKPYSLS